MLDLAVNSRIRSSQVRLIDAEGNQVGIIDTSEALILAEEAGLDLVEVAPDANPPVAKIADYGKMKYEASIRDREARKHQTHIVVKELKIRPRIDHHDLETKVAQARKFLNHGDRVRFTMNFRGREASHTEVGFKLFQEIRESLVESGHAEYEPALEGRNLGMLIVPELKHAPTE